MAVIFEDTRQKVGQHESKRRAFEEAGYTVERTKLYVGDYMLPGGTVCVDTKQHIYELAADVRQQHERFRSECERALDAGYQLVILVENEDGVSDIWGLADWIEPIPHFAARQKKSKGRVKRRLSGTQLFKACRTMEARYGTRFEFCEPARAGARVLSILDGEVVTDARDDA